MSGHTPGPWSCSNEGWGDGMLDVRGPSNEPVCRIQFLTDYPGDESPEFMPNYEADRDLITAAPDLLEALIGLLDDPLGDRDPARAAIARAKGEK